MAPASSEQDFPPLFPAEAAVDSSSPPIAIKVGSPNPQMFYVDNSVFRKSFNFFDAALKKAWKEGQQRTVDLPECDPEGFNVYINWLHSGNVYAKMELEDDSDRCYDLLTKAYIVGDRLLDVDFKDKISDEVAYEGFRLQSDGHLYIMGPEARGKLYGNSVPEAPIRLLVARTLINCGELERHVDPDEPWELLYNIMLELVRKGSQTDAELLNMVADCKFHEHEPGSENCYRNKRL